ncbi:MAG TPA: hypothetical protein VGB13_10980 [Candidatus Krumholzibacteria bacterium]
MSAVPPPDLMDCFSALAKSWREFGEKLSPRERLAMQFGLHASHAEEALTTGDVPRAEAHFLKMQEIMKVL